MESGSVCNGYKLNFCGHPCPRYCSRWEFTFLNFYKSNQEPLPKGPLRVVGTQTRLNHPHRLIWKFFKIYDITFPPTFLRFTWFNFVWYNRKFNGNVAFSCLLNSSPKIFVITPYRPPNRFFLITLILFSDFCVQCTSSQTHLTCISEESINHSTYIFLKIFWKKFNSFFTSHPRHDMPAAKKRNMLQQSRREWVSIEIFLPWIILLIELISRRQRSPRLLAHFGSLEHQRLSMRKHERDLFPLHWTWMQLPRFPTTSLVVSSMHRNRRIRLRQFNHEYRDCLPNI